MISVRDLSHSFASKEVLKNISFTVSEGEILAVMGSSGGGKTTLLRCVSGLIQASKGMVEINGVSVYRDPDHARRSMGMVFQSAALFDYLNVEQNILFGVKRHHRLTSREEEALLKDSLARVNLQNSEHLFPSELSGGMRKRVGMARAIALNPKVLLYDEPTTGLDPITTFQIDSLIAELRKNLNVTSILVSHDLVSVQRTADRVAFLHQGELVFVGTPDAFIRSDHPAITELVQKSQSTAPLSRN